MSIISKRLDIKVNNIKNKFEEAKLERAYLSQFTSSGDKADAQKRISSGDVILTGKIINAPFGSCNPNFQSCAF